MDGWMDGELGKAQACTVGKGRIARAAGGPELLETAPGPSLSPPLGGGTRRDDKALGLATRRGLPYISDQVL